MNRLNLRRIGIIVIGMAAIFIAVIINNAENENGGYGFSSGDSLKIISSTENQDLEPIINDYARFNNIDIKVEYEKTLDIIDKLNGNNDYDAVWISNSMWLYMLNSSVRTSDSKIINI